MTRIDHRLFAALALSLSLHLLPMLLALISPPQQPSTAASSLTAELRPPPPAPAAAPPLTLPEPSEPPKPASHTPKPPAKAGPQAPKTWTQTVREHLKTLQAAGQFYPVEAIAQGLEGDVEILLIIDEAGKVSAARVEHGSGHAILDDAALHAVRALQSLPADAPRQVVLPVRFRLH